MHEGVVPEHPFVAPPGGPVGPLHPPDIALGIQGEPAFPPDHAADSNVLRMQRSCIRKALPGRLAGGIDPPLPDAAAAGLRAASHLLSAL